MEPCVMFLKVVHVMAHGGLGLSFRWSLCYIVSDLVSCLPSNKGTKPTAFSVSGEQRSSMVVLSPRDSPLLRKPLLARRRTSSDSTLFIAPLTQPADKPDLPSPPRGFDRWKPAEEPHTTEYLGHYSGICAARYPHARSPVEEKSSGRDHEEDPEDDSVDDHCK